MTNLDAERPNDLLLAAGTSIAAIIQFICAVAVLVVIVAIPIIVLASMGALPASVGLNDLPIIEASPIGVLAIAVLLALILGAFFSFFGKLRALIRSAGEGDPFIPENAKRLNAMAWLLLAALGLALPVGGLRYYLASLVGDAPQQVELSLFDLEGLLLVIVLFILARIFRIGAAMRDDLEGTV